MATKLIVGLGNPGRQYEKTRHNLGFLAVLKLAAECAVDLKKSRHADAVTGEVDAGAWKALLVLPLTFMNHSGFAVRDVAGFDKVAPADILVVSDDIRLDFGEMRLKSEGSAGGHNGLSSIIQELGTGAFPRLRLGVGAPPPGMDQADYVLSNFSVREAKSLEAFIDRAVECCRLWLSGDTARAMTEFNKRKDTKDNG